MSRITARRITAATIHSLGDLVRVGALLAIVVIIAAYIDPSSGWKIDAPAASIAVLAFALLGVERVGLALYALGDRVQPNSPQQPTH